jgi:hypothetical protein
MGQKGTKLELDPKKLSAFGVRDHASTRPWSDDQEVSVAIQSAQDHVPTDLGGTERRTIARRSTTCNRFYIRRVRHSFLSDNAHASAPHVSDLTHMREHLGGRLPTLMECLLHGSIHARVCRLSIACAIRKNFFYLALLTAVGEINRRVY